MNLLKLLKFIVHHPLNRDAPGKAIGRFVRWQIASRLLRRPVSLPYANGTALLTEQGMTGATGNWYCGLHECEEMGFVLHALRANDLFVDIGANIGSYTVLAAGAVGANVIAVEPLPSTFARLQANINHNELGARVQPLRCGLSSNEGDLQFTSGLDTMNRVALPDEALPTVAVPVRTLDDICDEQTPLVLKIDVEGHEAAVLAGGRRTLGQDSLQAVLMETNGSGENFGLSDQVLLDVMDAAGFTACTYDAIRRELSPSGKGTHNTIFVRDVAAIQARCREAPRYSLINGSI